MLRLFFLCSTRGIIKLLQELLLTLKVLLFSDHCRRVFCLELARLLSISVISGLIDVEVRQSYLLEVTLEVSVTDQVVHIGGHCVGVVVGYRCETVIYHSV